MKLIEYMTFADYMHKVRMSDLNAQQLYQGQMKAAVDQGGSSSSVPVAQSQAETDAKLAEPQAVADFREWQKRKGLR